MEFYNSCKKLFDDTAVLCKEQITDNHIIKQINVKIDHSYRTVDIITKLFNEFNCKNSYLDLAKSVMMLHDYGRLDQMAQTGTYNDSVSFVDINEIDDHGEYGAFLLFEVGWIKKTDIDPIYYDMVFDSIFYHAKQKLPNYLNFKINKNIFKYNPEIILKEQPLEFKSLYAQAVRDSDKLDIYNQVISGEIPSLYENLNFKISQIDYIEKKLKIDKKKILELNGVKSFDELKKIKIPLDEIDIKNLKIDEQFYKQFKNGNILPLKQLFNEPFYNFFCAGLVRLNFLKDINFKESYKYVIDNDLLYKMYNTYPDIYKPIVKDAFEYTDDYIKKKIKHK
ncbi:MAG: hypothetical protein IJ134_01300 [Bacilli bacterium]|nr:hypothetical protein [Bacilli bacterium]